MPPMERLCILVLEPESLLSFSFAMMIRGAGHHAITITTPDQAYELLQNDDYDALVIGQPRGEIDAHLLAKRAKLLCPNLCIIYGCACDDQGMHSEFIDTVLNPPYSYIQLLNALLDRTAKTDKGRNAL
jgi:DNA-binding NtrC family response regulator